MIQHPCKYAYRPSTNREDAILCKKTCSNCKAQYFCHIEKYWKPANQIKCPNFEREEQKEE